MKIEIDVEQFARDIKAGKSIGGSDGALGSLIKQLTEAALAAEIDSHHYKDLQSVIVVSFSLSLLGFYHLVQC